MIATYLFTEKRMH